MNAVLAALHADAAEPGVVLHGRLTTGRRRGKQGVLPSHQSQPSSLALQENHC